MRLVIGKPNKFRMPPLPTWMICSKHLEKSRENLAPQPALNFGMERLAGQLMVSYTLSKSQNHILMLPQGGSDYGAATAGTKNAFYFWKQGVCAALDWNINLFYFSAFDEPWKPDSKGADGKMGDEKHWGAFTSDRQAKFDDYSCKYLVPDTSS